VISAVEFDSDGSYLATGDKGGRVVLFEKVPMQVRVVVRAPSVVCVQSAVSLPACPASQPAA
jgi:hypothetical protein